MPKLISAQVRVYAGHISYLPSVQDYLLKMISHTELSWENRVPQVAAVTIICTGGREAHRNKWDVSCEEHVVSGRPTNRSIW